MAGNGQRVATGILVRVAGRDFGGWKAARVTRGIEAIAGSFEVAVTDRWAGRLEPWPIAAEDECSVLLDGETVVTGYIDRRSLSYGAQEHTLSVAGRDKAAALVDCSAVLGKQWEFWGVSLLKLAQMLARPFGISVSMQPGLADPKLTQKLSVDPGDSAFDALERACRMAGVLPVSDGKGAIVLTRAGSVRCTTALMEGRNILSASGEYDAAGRYRLYIVSGQHPGTDEYAGDATATVRGSASDPNVRRASRVLVVRSENSITPDLANKRAQWEAKVRAARGDALSVTVQGWRQGDGSLWPVNALVNVKSPLLGASGQMLITQAVHSLDEHQGTTTQLSLKRPDAFTPEPVVPSAAYPELAGGV